MKNLTVSKADLISKLKTIEGLTNEERANLIGLLREHKKYGLVWEDKPEDVEERLRDQLPVLCEVKDKAIVSDLPDAPNHILIEGDNLEALTALSYTHEGKIDVIYIDPPYNTGNKDFVYNDSFVDSEDSYRHSKWLSFMNKRLKIAKKLLSDKGVIFISIDDNEQANLKLLCDEVFGASNHISSTIIASNSAKNLAKFISVTHEYILIYSKNKEYTLTNWQVKKNNLDEFLSIVKKLKSGGLSNEEISKELRFLVKYPKYYEFDHYTYVDDRGPFRCSDYTAPGSSNYYDIIHPITGQPCRIGSRGWGHSKEETDKLIKEDRVYFGEDESSQPALKNYLVENSTSLAKSILFFDSQVSTKWMKQQKLDFPFPKALDLIKYIIAFYPQTSFSILDFFAGSGTTLHATMQLNAEDGGHRQCILVTNNENNICEEVTYERNKRVINGYTTPKGVEVAGLKGNTLRYYKTDYISRDRTQKNMRALVAAATDMLCIKEDLYEELKKFGRVKVNPRVMRYFSDGKKHMLVVYREEFVDELVEEIKSLTPAPSPKERGVGRLKIYIFSPGRYAFDDSFYEVRDKVQLVALPAAIYDAYVKVLPKRKEQLLDTENQIKTKIPTDLFNGVVEEES